MSAPAEVLASLSAQRIIPVIRTTAAERSRAEIVTFITAGYRAIELTLTTPDALDIIQEFSKSDVLIGAGSVLTRTDADAAVTAGAKFLVSPVHPAWLLPLADELGVAGVPGASTATEVFAAVEAGAALVKVFPIARLGGPAFIRDLLAPMPDLPLMATGGVNLSTAGPLLDAGCVAVGLGSILNGADLEQESAVEAARAVLSLA